MYSLVSQEELSLWLNQLLFGQLTVHLINILGISSAVLPQANLPSKWMGVTICAGLSRVSIEQHYKFGQTVNLYEFLKLLKLFLD